MIFGSRSNHSEITLYGEVSGVSQEPSSMMDAPPWLKTDFLEHESEELINGRRYPVARLIPYGARQWRCIASSGAYGSVDIGDCVVVPERKISVPRVSAIAGREYVDLSAVESIARKRFHDIFMRPVFARRSTLVDRAMRAQKYCADSGLPVLKLYTDGRDLYSRNLNQGDIVAVSAVNKIRDAYLLSPLLGTTVNNDDQLSAWCHEIECRATDAAIMLHKDCFFFVIKRCGRNLVEMVPIIGDFDNVTVLSDHMSVQNISRESLKMVFKNNHDAMRSALSAVAESLRMDFIVDND